MNVILSKLLPAFIYPVGLLALLLIAAILLYKKRRAQMTLLVAALVLLFVAGNRWTAYSLVRSLERRNLPVGGLPDADAIVVLGGGTELVSPPRPFQEINGAGDRVIYAARLYLEGKAPVILATGGRIAWYGPAASTPASEMQTLLEFMGVPPNAILLEDQSQNTAENASLSAPLLRAHNAQKILLVTSAMHMPRASALFAAQGFEIFPAPTDFIVADQDWDILRQGGLAGNFLDLFPSGSSLNLTTNALKESLGLLALRLVPSQ
jgi:uncharacterized SAM-binding protein YcdF (DUF218 family)